MMSTPVKFMKYVYMHVTLMLKERISLTLGKMNALGISERNVLSAAKVTFISTFSYILYY